MKTSFSFDKFNVAQEFEPTYVFNILVPISLTH